MECSGKCGTIIIISYEWYDRVTKHNPMERAVVPVSPVQVEWMDRCATSDEKPRSGCAK
jgi:hypothetical protein